MNRSNPTEIRAGNATWQGRRPEQQDAFGFSDFDDTRLRAHGGVLMVLADGMGGLHGGREASRLAVARLLGTWAGKAPDETIPAALERALAAANRAVYELAQASAGEGSVGTTLVAVAVHDGAAHWVSVGDSRLYLYRAADDSLTRCTDDHTHANQLRAEIARGERPADTEAESDPDAEALVSFLGLREIPAVDRSLRPLPLAPGDRLLLCSDGVYNRLPPERLAPLLRQDAQDAAEALISAVQACATPEQDNASATVLAFGPLPMSAQIAAARSRDGPSITAVANARRTPTSEPTDAPTAQSAPMDVVLRRWLSAALAALAALALLVVGLWIGVQLERPATPPAPEPAPTVDPTLAPAAAPADVTRIAPSDAPAEQGLREMPPAAAEETQPLPTTAPRPGIQDPDTPDAPLNRIDDVTTPDQPQQLKKLLNSGASYLDT